jgi:hypothetical protein
VGTMLLMGAGPGTPSAEAPPQPPTITIYDPGLIDLSINGAESASAPWQDRVLDTSAPRFLLDNGII